MSKASRAILIPQKTLKAVVETLSNATISYKQAEATSTTKLVSSSIENLHSAQTA